jgi:hypothetical protein
MIALLCFFLTLFASPFKSKSRLEAENAALRHQLIVLRRRVRGRVQLTNGDNPDPLAKNGPISQHARLAKDACRKLKSPDQI